MLLVRSFSFFLKKIADGRVAIIDAFQHFTAWSPADRSSPEHALDRTT